MIKKHIEQLILQSYTGDNLDIKKVERLIAGISRRDLKMYIRALKNWENKRSIEIQMPDNGYQKNIKIDMIKKLFPNKKVKYSLNPSLISGIKIINQDTIYDFNLKNTLEDIIDSIIKQYD